MPRYQVSLWAENIKYGWFRKPDCYAEVEDGDGNVIGKTETHEADQNPDWIKVLFLEADESSIVTLNVKVYHARVHDDPVLLTESSFEATEVNQATGHMLTQETENGSISMSVVESNPKMAGTASLHFRGLDIRNVEPGFLGLGRSDPFFEIAKKTFQASTGSTRWNVVYRSKAIEDHLNPLWEPVETMGLEELCDGDLDAGLRVAVFDAKKGANRMIGSFEASVNQLQERVGVKGNADRDMAFELGLEHSTDTFGLICVLACEVDMPTQQ